MSQILQFRREQLQPLPLCLTTTETADKTYIVTGANGGLGYEAVKHLAALKARRVIMAVRNLEAGETALRQIEAETKTSGALLVWHLDLARYDSVVSFVKKVESQLDRVDGVILNAAVGMGRWIVCEEGREMNMTVNLVSQVLLTVGLMPYLKQVGKKTGCTPRITIIGSGAAFSGMGELCWKKLDKRNIMEDVKYKDKWKGQITELYVHFHPITRPNLLTPRQLPILQAPPSFRRPPPGGPLSRLQRRRHRQLRQPGSLLHEPRPQRKVQPQGADHDRAVVDG